MTTEELKQTIDQCLTILRQNQMMASDTFFKITEQIVGTLESTAELREAVAALFTIRTEEVGSLLASLRRFLDIERTLTQDGEANLSNRLIKILESLRDRPMVLWTIAKFI